MTVPVIDKDLILEQLFATDTTFDTLRRGRLSRDADTIMRNEAEASNGAILVSHWRRKRSLRNREHRFSGYSIYQMPSSFSARVTRRSQFSASRADADIMTMGIVPVIAMNCRPSSEPSRGWGRSDSQLSSLSTRVAQSM